MLTPLIFAALLVLAAWGLIIAITWALIHGAEQIERNQK